MTEFDFNTSSLVIEDIVIKENNIRVYYNSDIGFGTLTILKENNKYEIDTEYMCNKEDTKFLELLLIKVAAHIMINSKIT